MSADRGQRGFSLLEALISLTIFLLALTATFSLYLPARQLYAHGDQRTQLQQNARLALAQIARQIRMAGYFPENLAASPPSPLLSDPIRVATNAALAVYGDTDDTGTSRVVMFCRQGNYLRRTRNTVSSSSSFTCSSGDIIAENAVGLRFAYYDAGNNAIPSPPTTPYQLDAQSPGSVPNMSTTTQRRQVRRILVTLTTRGNVPGKGTEDFTLTSDVWIRNGS